MHENHSIEKHLRKEAQRLSEEYDGAPVIIVVGGDSATNIPRTMLASCIEGRGREVRLRDLLGILQTAIQIETLKHFKIPPFKRS